MIGFGFYNGKLLLKEGKLLVGTVVSPETIFQPGDGDPEAHFSGVYIGFFQQGSVNLNINRTYVEALADTPAEIVAKDLIRKQYLISLNSFQFSPDHWELFDGYLVVRDYSAGGFVGQGFHMGFDEPVQNPNAYLLKTKLRDGTPYNFMTYSSLAQGTNISEARSGTNYVTKLVEITPFRHPNFQAGTYEEAQKVYGCGWLDESP